MSFTYDIGGIPCEPLWEGFDEGVNDQGPYATIPYLVDWDRRWDLIRAIRGSSTTTGGVSPWNRVNPIPYPDPSMGVNIYAKSATIKPEGNVVVGSDPFAATHATVVVTFGVLQYTVDFQNDPLFLNSLSQDAGENDSLQYATQEVDFGAEWINIPNSSAGFPDGLKIDTPMSRRITVHTMRITWNRYPLMPMTKLRDYADSVNDATFLGCDRGTVFFEGPRIVRAAETDGTVSQKVSMTLKWRKHDWNEFLRPDDNSFDTLIYNGDSSSSTYPYKNFRALLL